MEIRKIHRWAGCGREYVITWWQLFHMLLISFTEPYVPGEQADESFNNQFFLKVSSSCIFIEASKRITSCVLLLFLSSTEQIVSKQQWCSPLNVLQSALGVNTSWEAAIALLLSCMLDRYWCIHHFFVYWRCTLSSRGKGWTSNHCPNEATKQMYCIKTQSIKFSWQESMKHSQSKLMHRTASEWWKINVALYLMSPRRTK